MSIPDPKPPTAGMHRQDTSICSHLRGLLDARAAARAEVKIDPEEIEASGSDLNDVERRFIEIIRWGASEQGVKRRRAAAPACHSCSKPLTRPFACLTCSFVGCMDFGPSTSTAKTQCLRGHWSENRSCGFAVDPSAGAVFCSTCDDFSYPDSFDALFRQTRIKVEEENDTSREQSVLNRGRGRGEWKPWEGSMTSGSYASSSCRGLRPLLNLSQTCFLSAILQAFIHNPLLKAYFLSEKHNRHVCSHRSKGLAVGKPYAMDAEGTVAQDRERGCMCCEMDRAFEEFHGDDKTAYGPITMLYTMWHASAELEGHGQQDAHSFFLAALDQIHAHANGKLASCNCIAHQTFAGSLLSSVTCSSCNTTSSTIDPTLSIQLDFPNNFPENTTLSLTDMLKRFCAEEKVSEHGRGYDCASCGGGVGVAATRKLIIKKLPPVLSFQLKRFAHNSTSTKVELPVRFPSQLDMRSFVESSSTHAHGSSSTTPTSDTERARMTKPLPASLYQYDLFAVVTHQGSLDNGHYWADVLSEGEWWHCDDDKITPTTLKNVQSQKAYMLFYVKRTLAYAQPHSKLLPIAPSTSFPTPNRHDGEGMDMERPRTGDKTVANKATSNPSGGRTGHPIAGMAV